MSPTAFLQFPVFASIAIEGRNCAWKNDRFKEWGFEKGWGDTAERVKETMRSLSEVLQSPDPVNMEKFLGRLPIIFNVVLFSVHGYFGQSDVLGLPDTGGQVESPILAIKTCQNIAFFFFLNKLVKTGCLCFGSSCSF